MTNTPAENSLFDASSDPNVTQEQAVADLYKENVLLTRALTEAQQRLADAQAQIEQYKIFLQPPELTQNQALMTDILPWQQIIVGCGTEDPDQLQLLRQEYATIPQLLTDHPQAPISEIIGMLGQDEVGQLLARRVSTLVDQRLVHDAVEENKPLLTQGGKDQITFQLYPYSGDKATNTQLSLISANTLHGLYSDKNRFCQMSGTDPNFYPSGQSNSPIQAMKYLSCAAHSSGLGLGIDNYGQVLTACHKLATSPLVRPTEKQALQELQQKALLRVKSKITFTDIAPTQL